MLFLEIGGAMGSGLPTGKAKTLQFLSFIQLFEGFISGVLV